jgi:hypothetical protein
VQLATNYFAEGLKMTAKNDDKKINVNERLVAKIFLFLFLFEEERKGIWRGLEANRAVGGGER